ncbi:MAG: M48 family metalloprotease [Acidobacteriota bacterium]
MLRALLSRLLLTTLALMLAAPLALASGEIWRYPETTNYRGASQLVFPVDADFGGKKRKRWMRWKKTRGNFPGMEVLVLDEDGRPQPGVKVEVMIRNSKERRGPQAEAVTGNDGRVRMDPLNASNIREVWIRMYWREGSRRVRAILYPTGDSGWLPDDIQYWNSFENEYQGSCGNLSNLARVNGSAGDGPLLYTFRIPDTLLGCENVEYGQDRKTALFSDMNNVGRRDLNAGDKNFFSGSQEESMALDVEKMVREQYDVISDPVIEPYLRDILHRLVAVSDAPDQQINLHLINTDQINAFATAGGHVYVFTGLITAAENEAQLAGVLAHELTHVLSRHVTEGMTRAVKQQGVALVSALALGQLADLDANQQQMALQGALTAAGLNGLRYGRRAETESDLLGMQYLWRAGWDPEGIAQFFHVLEQKHPNNVPAWMSSHPTHDQRISNGLHWSRSFLPEKTRYLVSTAEFERAKARVRTLPAPRKRAQSQEQQQAGLAGLMAQSPTAQSLLEQIGNYQVQQMIGPPPEQHHHHHHQHQQRRQPQSRR